VRDSAHYNWTKTKSTYARLAQELGFGSGNWFWLSTIAQFSVAGKKAQQRCAPAERKECNK
jgi:hypothetical protein